MQELVEPISASSWSTFLTRIPRVSMLVDDGFTICPRLGPALCQHLSHHLPATAFKSLTTLCVSIRHAYMFIMSPLITDLTLLITKGEDAQIDHTPSSVSVSDVRAFRQALRAVGSSLTQVEILRIDGDDEIAQLRKEIAALCSRFSRLRQVVLAPSALLEDIISSLLRVRSLSILDVAECGRTTRRKVVIDDTGGLESVSALSRPRAAVDLQRLGLKFSTTFSASKLFGHRSFPSQSITNLWMRFPSVHSLPDGSVRSLLVVLRGACVNLSCLTLRFGPSAALPDMNADFVSCLHIFDIDPIFEWTSLHDFSIDHPRSLHLSDVDYITIATNTVRFTRLWLNPFPLFPSSTLIGLRALGYFASSGRNLRSIALCLDATDVSDLSSSLPVLTTLQEFFVGWSRVATAGHHPIYEVQWKIIAHFLLSIFPPGVSIVTLQDMVAVGPWSICRSDTRPSWMLQGAEKTVAVAYSFSWKCVAILIDSLRVISSVESL